MELPLDKLRRLAMDRQALHSEGSEAHQAFDEVSGPLPWSRDYTDRHAEGAKLAASCVKACDASDGHQALIEAAKLEALRRWFISNHSLSDWVAAQGETEGRRLGDACLSVSRRLVSYDGLLNWLRTHAIDYTPNPDVLVWRLTGCHLGLSSLPPDDPPYEPS